MMRILKQIATGKRLGAIVIVGLAAPLLAAFLIGSASRAAFTDTADNSGNQLTAGTVTLTDDDSVTAMFNVSTMAPGDSVSNCILVTYSGSIADPAAVKMYSGGFTDSGNFGDYLNVTISEGSGATFGSCGSFTGSVIYATNSLTTFDTNVNSYASGVGSWDPSSTPETKAFQVTIALDPSTPNAEQSEGVTALIFTWEVQSN